MKERGPDVHLNTVSHSSFKGKRLAAYREAALAVAEDLGEKLGDNADSFVEGSVAHLLAIGASLLDAEQIVRRMSLAWVDDEAPLYEEPPVEFLPRSLSVEKTPVDRESILAEIAEMKLELPKLREVTKEVQVISTKIYRRQEEVKRLQDSIRLLEKKKVVAQKVAKNARARYRELEERTRELEGLLEKQ